MGADSQVMTTKNESLKTKRGLPWVTLTVLALLAATAYFIPPSLQPQDQGTETWLFFDGVCNLCDGFVNFVHYGDSRAKVKFGALQRHTELVRQHGGGRYVEGGEEALSTLVVIQGSQVYVRSEAALRVLAVMDQPYRTLAMFHFIPVFLRDAIYKLVAANRYNMFGKVATCRAPTEKFKARFLEYTPPK